MLVEAGARVNSLDHECVTPIINCIYLKNDKLDVLEYFLSLDELDPNITCYLGSFLHVAAIYNKV